jgi:5-methylcytosine-specific restriction protein A
VPMRVRSFRPAWAPGLEKQRADYDRLGRDRAAKAFYNSGAWVGCRRVKLARDPLCEACKARGELVAATQVHHTVAVADSVDGRLDVDNLVSLCASCHSRIEASRA